MAGSFKALFKDSFTNQSTITVNHNLNLLQVAVIVNINGEARNDLIQSINPNPADPRNSIIINLISSQTGVITCVDSDYVFINIPTPENAADLSPGLPSFGRDYQSASDSSIRTNTSTNLVQAQKLTTTNIPAGTYRIEWNYIWSYNSSSSDFRAVVEVDDTTQIYEHIRSCLLYTSPSPRDVEESRMPSSA